MMCLWFEPWTAGWKAQMNQLSYGSPLKCTLTLACSGLVPGCYKFAVDCGVAGNRKCSFFLRERPSIAGRCRFTAQCEWGLKRSLTNDPFFPFFRRRKVGGIFARSGSPTSTWPSTPAVAPPRSATSFSRTTRTTDWTIQFCKSLWTSHSKRETQSFKGKTVDGLKTTYSQTLVKTSPLSRYFCTWYTSVLGRFRVKPCLVPLVHSFECVAYVAPI